LYGLRAPEVQQSVLFQQNDFLRPNEDKKSAGRNASRKEELEQKNKEREASTSGARGTTISARTDVVFAMQQDAAEQQRDYENKVLILNQMIKNLTEEIGSAERQAERSCPLYDPNHDDWVEHHNLIQKRKRKREELESLSDEMKKPRQVKNLVLQSLVKTVNPSSYGDLCGGDGDKKPKAKPSSRPRLILCLILPLTPRLVLPLALCLVLPLVPLALTMLLWSRTRHGCLGH
jgi:hypothetical protein